MGDFVDFPGWFGPADPGTTVVCDTEPGNVVVATVAKVTPGVKPSTPAVVVVRGIVVVVVELDVVVVVGADGSTTVPAGRVVVVVVGGALTTFTATEYDGSVINMTTERLLYTSVILPIIPAAFNTGIPTLMPHSEPRLISTV
jgi:hypothetical protein